jgi:hypothetical protein
MIPAASFFAEISMPGIKPGMTKSCSVEGKHAPTTLYAAATLRQTCALNRFGRLPHK